MLQDVLALDSGQMFNQTQINSRYIVSASKKVQKSESRWLKFQNHLSQDAQARRKESPAQKNHTPTAKRNCHGL